LSIKIGDREIKRGEKAKGYVKAGEASTHDVMMPYVIVNGSEPGKTLCVIGGVHPLEYTSIEGVLRVAQEVEPENTDGFNARAAFNNPVDYVNQNRVFPGSPDESLSRRVANCLYENFVSKAEALIDSHGGDLTEDIYKYVIIGKTDNEKLHKTMMDMASCYDTLYIQTTEIKGSSGEALRKYGIPCITPESGTPYPVREEEVAFHRDGIINIMKYFGMLEGEPEMKTGVPFNPEQARIRSDRGGLWIQKAASGERVKKGQVLGEVVDLFGDTLQTVTAPFDGVTNNSRTSVVANSGDVLIFIYKI
jgi:predicted deacylase